MLNVLVVFKDNKMVETRGHEKPWSLKCQNKIQFCYKQVGPRSFIKEQCKNTGKQQKDGLKMSGTSSNNNNNNNNKKRRRKQRSKKNVNSINDELRKEPRWLSSITANKWVGVPVKKIKQTNYQGIIGVKMFEKTIHWIINYCVKTSDEIVNNYVGINSINNYSTTLLKRIERDVNGIGVQYGITNLHELIMYVYILVFMCIYVHSIYWLVILIINLVIN